MYVEKTYCAHFFLKGFVDRPLNIYGVKSEKEIYKIGKVLINSGVFDRAYYTVNWKETKQSRWKKEEHIFLTSKLENTQ